MSILGENLDIAQDGALLLLGHECVCSTTFVSVLLSDEKFITVSLVTDMSVLTPCCATATYVRIHCEPLIASDVHTIVSDKHAIISHEHIMN